MRVTTRRCIRRHNGSASQSACCACILQHRLLCCCDEAQLLWLRSTKTYGRRGIWRPRTWSGCARWRACGTAAPTCSPTGSAP